MKKNIIVFVIQLSLLVLFSCNYNNENSVLLQDNDSIKYFKDFDMLSFTPINSLNNKIADFPYIEVYYRDNVIVSIKYHTQEGNFSEFFQQINGEMAKISFYNPDGFFSYGITFLRQGKLIDYSFHSNTRVYVQDEKLIGDSSSWLNIISVGNKKLRYRYFFNDNDSIPKHEIFNINLEHNSLLRTKQLNAYIIDSMWEYEREFILKEYIYDKTESGFQKKIITYKFPKDSVLIGNGPIWW